MSSISQIVALHRRAAQQAQTPGSVRSEVVPDIASATVTLGAVRAPVTYTTRIRRAAAQDSAAAASVEQEQEQHPERDSAALSNGAEAVRWWDGAPRHGVPWLDTTA